MQTFFLRLWAVFGVTLKRLVAQRGLALAALTGILVAVALTMSIPIYADGIYQRILSSELRQNTATHPPFAFMFRYIGAWSGPLPIENLGPVDAYLSGPAADAIGLSHQDVVKFQQTDTMRLFLGGQGSTYSNRAQPTEWVTFGAISAFQKHIQILEGTFPTPAPADTQQPVEVLISEDLALATGLQAGESFVVYSEYKAEKTTVTIQIPVRVSGVWRAQDARELYWFYQTDSFRTVLIVPEASFASRIVSAQGNQISAIVWYWLADGSHLHSSEVAGLLSQIAEVRARAVNLLPNVRLDISPEETLQNFQKSANSLSTFLYAFSIPILGMTLTFIGLVVDMVVSQRRNEIAVLRSRGATVLQVLGISLLECLVLGIAALAIGAPGAALIASAFGQAISFLNFSAQTPIQADITPDALKFGLLAVGISAVFMLLPTLGAARHTIISYKQERARSLRPPWWQRAWLDGLLLIPAAYGMYLMKQQGGLILPGQNPNQAMDPFQNPLLLLVPALGIFALTLLILRLLPLVMALVAWLASKTSSVGLLMAARYLSRSAGGYNAPLILLVLTLSLSIFTASMAQTLDRHVSDQTYYHSGADMVLDELGESTDVGGQEEPSQAAAATQPAAAAAASGPQWLFLPVSEHLKIPGVSAAARVKDTAITLTINGKNVTSRFMGVDRVDFGQTAFWRRDFAPEPLGALMNDLARTTEGVLVSREILNRGISLGDNLRATVFMNPDRIDIDFKVVGVFDYFPTWVPGDNPLVVGNLDYFFERVGGESPYKVWLKLAPTANAQVITKMATQLYKKVLPQSISREALSAAQSRPERQGFFGLLSVGFVALAFLTILGFLLYAFFSFRRRTIELGMLRAIGLSAAQMIGFLAAELAFLFAVGLGAGTGLGVWVSELFIPGLQVGNALAARVPPFLVQIDWPAVFQIYILFGLVFLAALVILILLLLRMKVFQAIKLGEVA